MLEAVHRIRTPFNANGPAMAAAAAAVSDTARTDMIRRHNARAMENIDRRLSALGLHVVPSVTNFYLIRFPADIGTTAGEADQRLQAAGIIPRPVGGDSDSELRITVGSDEENEAVLTAFESFMKQPASRSG